MYFYDKFVNNQNILINISVLTTALTKNTEKWIALFQVHVLVYVRVLSSKFFFHTFIFPHAQDRLKFTANFTDWKTSSYQVELVETQFIHNR